MDRSLVAAHTGRKGAKSLSPVRVAPTGWPEPRQRPLKLRGGFSDAVRSFPEGEWLSTQMQEVLMARSTLEGVRVAILATDGFEQSELTEPRKAPDAAGAVTKVVSPKAGKPVGAICHGPWTVIESGAAKGHRMTSWPSLKTDIRNAGADWVDQEVVVDANLVTSRKPDDIPAFNREIINLFSQSARH
jgi:protease I